MDCEWHPVNPDEQPPVDGPCPECEALREAAEEAREDEWREQR